MAFVVLINDINALLESWNQLLATTNGSQVFTANDEVLQTLNEWPRIKWFYYVDDADGNTLRIYDTEHFDHFGGYYLERDESQSQGHYERVILRGKNMWADDEANLNRPQSLRKRFRDNPAWVIYSSFQAPLRPGTQPPANLGLRISGRNPSTVDITRKMLRERRLWYFESVNQLPVYNPGRQGIIKPNTLSTKLASSIFDRIRAKRIEEAGAKTGETAQPGPTVSGADLAKQLQPCPPAPVAQGEPAKSAGLTPADLRRMPREQRQAILAAAAAIAEQDYYSDKELTGFEAFSEEALDDD